MTKIVYNACYGGFSLSDEAIERYAAIKGLTLYPEPLGIGAFKTYWTISSEDRAGRYLQGDERHAASLEERASSNKFCSDNQLYDRDIPRNDPALVQVVEELGDRANGAHARLRITDVAAGGRYRIEEYDGYETVVEPDDQEWAIA